MKNQKQTLHGLLHTLLGLVLVIPVVVDVTGLHTTLPWVAGALTVSAAVSRALAVPAIRDALPEWLRPVHEEPSGERGTNGSP
ncbi:hypothetical protein ACH46N_15010 [Streptomyces pristinaespiralis]|uniref:Holin n=2 Tax=Streptomyces pristinaespiralis TaxID=38300 RepID=B5H8R7_STRE2|nr:hypothetical protein [Streptomyces pristinaespiralis]ALC20359.1 hypothetical protein SPRI_2053 [Streptomyces pristinaespiralis]EDY63228.1 conserved hypothetical protein [Streptomyces pristinaespiralis ATCC 25486]QMU16775.1 hypothetical protein H3L99_26755 [Streptomyces pristinaespiralis]